MEKKYLKRKKNKSEQQKEKESKFSVDAFDRIHQPLQGRLYGFDEGETIIQGSEMASNVNQYNDWVMGQNHYHEPSYGQELYTIYNDAKPTIETIEKSLLDKIEGLFKKHPIQWEMLIYFYDKKMAESDIAELTGKKQSSVNRSIKRALNRIQTKLTPQEWESVMWVFNHIRNIQPTKVNSAEEKARNKPNGWYNKLRKNPSELQSAVYINGKILKVDNYYFDILLDEATLKKKYKDKTDWVNIIDPKYEGAFLKGKDPMELKTPQNFKQTEISYRGLNKGGTVPKQALWNSIKGTQEEKFENVIMISDDFGSNNFTSR